MTVSVVTPVQNFVDDDDEKKAVSLFCGKN